MKYKWLAQDEVLELVPELVHEVQMAGSRTSVLELVLELFQELVHEVQMAGIEKIIIEYS